jgi:hypothetical protein
LDVVSEFFDAATEAADDAVAVAAVKVLRAKVAI